MRVDLWLAAVICFAAAAVVLFLLAASVLTDVTALYLALGLVASGLLARCFGARRVPPP